MKINETVRKFLIDNSQEEYRKFSLSLLPPDTRILGVRLPLIKKYSKEICRGDWRKYLKYAQSYWYEEIMLQGFVIGSAKCEINERVDLIKGFLPKIKNWGICDSFSMGIKILEAMKDKFSQTVAVQAGNATCRACRIYPLCHGGCTQMKLEYKAPVGCLKGYTEEQKTKILSGRMHELIASRS